MCTGRLVHIGRPDTVAELPLPCSAVLVCFLVQHGKAINFGWLVAAVCPLIAHTCAWSECSGLPVVVLAAALVFSPYSKCPVAWQAALVLVRWVSI